ncbi:hypothetical protein [Chryseobacterium sp.]|uniref:hypothetical protein n=1 Tax=Chryseobacterium sp. TaxID=1871047 RepID=UPI003218E225
MAILAGSFFFLSSIQSCRHESLETEIVNVQADPLSYIKNEYMRGKDMISGKQIEWEKARKYNHGKNIILITVPIKNEGQKIIEELTFRIDNNKVSGHLWKFENEREFSSSDYNLSAHEIMEKMTGEASYVALEGSMRYKMKLVDGKFIEEIAYKGHGGNLPGRCKPCHGEIDEIVITVPGGGGTSGPPTTPTPPPPILGGTGPGDPPKPEPPQETEPCKKIKGQKGNANYNQKITDLNGKTGLKKETGYTQKTNGEYTYHDNASNDSNSNSLSLPINSDISGYMHTHVDNTTETDTDGNEIIRKGIKMFSPADVGYFMDMLRNASTAGRPLGDIYAVMVTSTGMYQIRFSGNTGQIKTFTKEEIKGLRESYKDTMGDTVNLESSFLKFLKEKMGIEGLDLYRIQQIGKTTEIKLSSDGKTKESDCP